MSQPSGACVPLRSGGATCRRTADHHNAHLVAYAICLLFAVLQAGPGQPPDVWLQLLERCAADSTCQRSIMRNHAQQLAQQQQQLSQQQLVNVDLQQQVTDLQQHLAGQQQHNMELQGELRALQALVQAALLQRPV